MKYLSVCSGIESATVAWHPLGWSPVAFAEIEAFPCAVLKHHYPQVPNRGDITRFHEWSDAAFDVLVGGTPCQSFSVAGLRAGMDDPRGQLLLSYLGIADRYRPAWLVWENVPGVLSIDGGRAFGSLLGGLARLGYGFAYRILDAQYFRLAQRRRRVFVVGRLGDWRRAAAVLFERASLSGHPAPSRATTKDATAGTLRSTDGGIDCNHASHVVAATLDASFARLQGCSGQDATHGHSHLIAFNSKDYGADVGDDLAPTLRAGNEVDGNANGGVMPAIAFEPRVASGRRSGSIRDTVSALTKESDRGDGFPCVAFDTTQITHRENRSNPQPGDPSPTLSKGAHPPAVAFESRYARNGRGAPSDVVPPLKAQSGESGKGDGAPLVAFADLADPVAANQARTYTREGSNNFRVSNIAHTGMQVRRLTPRECERLQGFPDDYTLITYRGKPAADGPRYKALGNAMAVPVMRWIGRRIAMVESIEAVA